MSDTIKVLSVQEVLDDMGYDIADEMVERNITRAIKFADAYLKGSIGTNYPTEDPRAKELALMIVNDVYDNKGLKDTVSGTGSLSCGAREVRCPCAWRGGACHCSRVMVGESVLKTR